MRNYVDFYCLWEFMFWLNKNWMSLDKHDINVVYNASTCWLDDSIGIFIKNNTKNLQELFRYNNQQKNAIVTLINSLWNLVAYQSPRKKITDETDLLVVAFLELYYDEKNEFAICWLNKLQVTELGSLESALIGVFEEEQCMQYFSKRVYRTLGYLLWIGFADARNSILGVDYQS
jgi:hypothetical protein